MGTRGVGLLVIIVLMLEWLAPTATQAQSKKKRKKQARPTSPLRIKRPGAILARIESMIGKDLRAWCKKQNLTYPPKQVLFRVFKKEQQFEIWGRSSTKQRLALIRTIPISKMDFAPGPKLKEGDYKTPEGFYSIDISRYRDKQKIPSSFSYYSPYGFMWICLDDKLIDQKGRVGRCSCFKICINYPNESDKQRSLKINVQKPGHSICIHGNEVTAGCISFTNRNFLPVFAFARGHDFSGGAIQLQIFPFRFEKADLKKEARAYFESHKDKAHLSAAAVTHFWDNLRLGYEQFNATRVPLKIRTGFEKKLRWWWTPDRVRQLKAALHARGHFGDFVGPLTDRIDDPVIIEALKAFQKAIKQKATGKAEKRLLKALNLYWYR